MDANLQIQKLNEEIKVKQLRISELQFELLSTKDTDRLKVIRESVISLRKEWRHLVYQKSLLEKSIDNNNVKGGR